ncbi:uncharacterized protein LOC124256332 [Haliotis rubra]|uniref:uncharacterized protein LOC124256332 n=1 Tax=Haliotis rubra TaxID=36100 RepID=UPI001EE531EB|nr:uncharacterized protein LOC124256332 [Haliotis rubra]
MGYHSSKCDCFVFHASIIYLHVEKDRIYIQRKQYLIKYCKKQENIKRMSAVKIRELHWFLDQPRIIYCPIAKSGSTFWRRAKEPRPVAYTCDACAVDYDIICKMETFEDDTRYILKR